MKYYTGNIIPEPNTIFVFGSNPEGRHGAGSAKVAVEQFGAIYGQAEGLQGNAYAIPTKELRKNLRWDIFHSINPLYIIGSIRRFYKYVRKHPELNFKIAYRNKLNEKTLCGYTGLELIECFIEASVPDGIPDNIWFSEEWYKTGLL